MTFLLRPEAEKDIDSILLYIANYNSAAAWNWYDELLECCGKLAEFPGMGVSRSDIRPDSKMFPLGKYLILYREAGADIDIVGVVHGARHWQQLFGGNAGDNGY